MKKSDIYDALSGIDEKYRMDSDDFEDIAAEFRRARIRTAEKIISFAACFVIAVAAGVNIHKKINISDQSSIIAPSYPAYTDNTDNNEPVYTKVSKHTVQETQTSFKTENNTTLRDTGTKAASSFNTALKTEKFTQTRPFISNTEIKTAVTVTPTTGAVTHKPQSGQTNSRTKPGTSYTAATTVQVHVTQPPLTTTAVSTENELATLPQWEAQDISQRYNEFEYGKLSYFSRVRKINADSVGEKICGVTAKGYDDQHHITHYADAEIYKIKNISVECAAAVKFKEHTSFYVYTSRNYFPDTLGDLMDALDLENTVSFGTMTLKNGAGTDDYDRGVIKSLLNANRSSPCNGNYSKKLKELTFSTGIELLGISEKVLFITEDGYINTNIMDQGYSFYIGKEAVKELADSLGTNNYEHVHTKTDAAE